MLPPGFPTTSHLQPESKRSWAEVIIWEQPGRCPCVLGLGLREVGLTGVRLLIQSGDLKGCREWLMLPRIWLSTFFVFTCQHPGVGGDRCLQWWVSCASEGPQRGQAWAGCGWVVRALSDSPIFSLEYSKIMSKGLFSRKKEKKNRRRV